MPTVVRDFGWWIWRMVPANPILVRVVYAGGRRMQHFYLRLFYLAALAGVVMFGVFTAQTAGGGSLADLAKKASEIFELLSVIQLAMVCILAPIFTAAAITQEKDSQTYNILLSTPLTNGQIVLGSLLSRLYFVLVLLLAAVPLFCIMMVYGGVTGSRIALSSALAASTAALTGSLAISISVIRIGTGRTVFSFYLAIAVYLIAIYSLSSWSFLIPTEAEPAPGRIERMSWLAPFHPFLSLWVVLGRTPAPDWGKVADYGFPGSYLLAYPQYSYILITMVISMVLILACLFFVRRGASEGEPGFFNRLFRSAKPEDSGDDRTRQPRRITGNPLAWRERAMGSSAAGGAALRYAILVIGLLLAILVIVYYATNQLTTALARSWLLGLVSVELGIALFIAVTTAATSMTREKESNTLFLLLATPVTSTEIIAGKIGGLIMLSWPLLLVPFLSVLLFLLFDLVSGRMFSAAGPVVYWEALITLPALCIGFLALACAIGLWASISQKRTLPAVFISAGLVLLCIGLLSVCGYAVTSTDGGPMMSAVLLPFSPLHGISLVIDPDAVLSQTSRNLSQQTLNACRFAAFIATLCVAGLYYAICYGIRNNLVRNFDMTIRKQMA